MNDIVLDSREQVVSQKLERSEMPIELSPSLDPYPEYAALVRGTEGALGAVLPPTAQAVWDVREIPTGKQSLVLALTDPWCFARQPPVVLHPG